MSEAPLSKIAIPNVAEGLAEAGFESLEDVAEARVEDLVEIDGIGEKTAGRLIEKAKEALAPAPTPPTPRAKPKPKPIEGLAPGRVVLYCEPNSQVLRPGIVVNVADPFTGASQLVVFCPPRPQPGGGRVPCYFVHAEHSRESEPPVGSWIWPPKE